MHRTCSLPCGAATTRRQHPTFQHDRPATRADSALSSGTPLKNLGCISLLREWMAGKFEIAKLSARTAVAALGTLIATGSAALAAPPSDPLSAGDTAWMLTSSALVLMMTIPGLALFYAGMVRKKNVLATLAQSFGATCIVTVLWMVIGYSIAFTPNPNASRQPVHRRRRSSASGHDETKIHQSAGGHDSGIRLHVLPDDLRHHHAGADRRRAGGPHEIFRLHVVHVAVAAPRLLPRSRIGSGAAAGWAPWARSTMPAAPWCI